MVIGHECRRIPAEGDQHFRWIVKQVLERGALGIIFPHLETREQAIYAVRTMRYPNQKGAKYPYPRNPRCVNAEFHPHARSGLPRRRLAAQP